MGNRPQHEEMTALGHETDEINNVAIRLLKILFEEEESQGVQLGIRMPRNTMGIPRKRKPMNLNQGGMKKPHLPVR